MTKDELQNRLARLGVALLERENRDGLEVSCGRQSLTITLEEIRNLPFDAINPYIFGKALYISGLQEKLEKLNKPTITSAALELMAAREQRRSATDIRVLQERALREQERLAMRDAVMGAGFMKGGQRIEPGGFYIGDNPEKFAQEYQQDPRRAPPTEQVERELTNTQRYGGSVSGGLQTPAPVKKDERPTGVPVIFKTELDL